MRGKLAAIILPIAVVALMIFGLIVHAAFENHILDLSADSARAHVADLLRVNSNRPLPAVAEYETAADTGAYTNLLIDVSSQPWRIRNNGGSNEADDSLRFSLLRRVEEKYRSTGSDHGSETFDEQGIAWAIAKETSSNKALLAPAAKRTAASFVIDKRRPSTSSRIIEMLRR